LPISCGLRRRTSLGKRDQTSSSVPCGHVSILSVYSPCCSTEQMLSCREHERGDVTMASTGSSESCCCCCCCCGLCDSGAPPCCCCCCCCCSCSCPRRWWPSRAVELGAVQLTGARRDMQRGGEHQSRCCNSAVEAACICCCRCGGPLAEWMAKNNFSHNIDIESITSPSSVQYEKHTAAQLHRNPIHISFKPMERVSKLNISAVKQCIAKRSLLSIPNRA